MSDMKAGLIGVVLCLGSVSGAAADYRARFDQLLPGMLAHYMRVARVTDDFMTDRATGTRLLYEGGWLVETLCRMREATGDAKYIRQAQSFVHATCRRATVVHNGLRFWPAKSQNEFHIAATGQLHMLQFAAGALHAYTFDRAASGSRDIALLRSIVDRYGTQFGAKMPVHGSYDKIVQFGLASLWLDRLGLAGYRARAQWALRRATHDQFAFRVVKDPAVGWRAEFPLVVDPVRGKPEWAKISDTQHANRWPHFAYYLHRCYPTPSTANILKYLHGTWRKIRATADEAHPWRIAHNVDGTFLDGKTDSDASQWYVPGVYQGWLYCVPPAEALPFVRGVLIESRKKGSPWNKKNNLNLDERLGPLSMCSWGCWFQSMRESR